MINRKCEHTQEVSQLLTIFNFFFLEQAQKLKSNSSADSVFCVVSCLHSFNFLTKLQ